LIIASLVLLIFFAKDSALLANETEIKASKDKKEAE